MAAGSIFESIQTGDIGILDGGINIGNSGGLSSKDLANIFGSMAQKDISIASQTREERKRRNQALVISLVSVVFLVTLYAIYFSYNKNAT